MSQFFAAMKTFPKTLYVKIEIDREVNYFVANEDAYVLCEQGEKIRIGVYKLVEINTGELMAQIRQVK